MLFTPFTLVLLGLGLVVGALIGYIIRKQVAKATNANAEARAEQILSEAKSKQQEVLQEAKNKRQELTLEAKEAAIKIIEEAKREETSRRNELQEIQKRLEKREELFDQKLIEFEDKKTKLEEKTKVVFNFEPTGHSQARVAINIGERLSFRIDHVPEDQDHNIKEAVYIDLATPAMNKLLNRVRDEHGAWHHFESRALKDFTDNEKFRELAEFIKQMLTEAGEHQEFTIENLVEKFKTK